MLFGFQGTAEASKKCAGKKASIYSYNFSESIKVSKYQAK